MTAQKNLLEMFKKRGAILEGHFLLSSGLHSSMYIQCALITCYPDLSETVGRMLAEKFRDSSVDIVIGPAIGGIIISYEVARHLQVRAIFTERVNGVMKLRRGFSIKKGEKVLVIEDVITTGKSTNEVIDVVKQYEGIVIGIGSIIDRSSQPPFKNINVKVESLIKLQLPVYEPDNCPLCKAQIPIVKPGSREIELKKN